MNYIGNYIHYNFKNYLNYGLARKMSRGGVYSSARSANFDTIIASLEKDTAIINVDSNKYKNLENVLNYFCRSGGTISLSNVTLTEEQAKVLEEMLLQVVEESTNSTAANFNSSNFFGMKQTQSLKTSRAGKGETGKYYLGAFNKRTDALITIIRSLQEEENGERLLVQAERLKSEWINLCNTVLKNQSEFALGKILPQVKGILSPGDIGYSKVDSFQKDLIELGKAVYAGMGANFINNKISNSLTTIMSSMANNIYEEKTNNLINKLKTNIGKNINITEQSGGSYSKQINPNLTAQYNENGMSYTIKGNSQGNVNLEVNLGETGLKDYSLNSKLRKLKEINLTSNSNLLEMLSKEPLFLNHYLNIAGTNATHNGFLLSQANSALKKFLIIQATQMLNDNGQVSNIFVTKDKANGRYKVFTMSDLLKKYKTQNNIINIKVNGRFVDSSLTWDNKWVGKKEFDTDLATIRINNLLNTLLVKVAINIKPDLF